ncbi:MAG TPA: phosphohistidine phosphatase SixA [Polyangia bacterium]
MDLFLIRHAHAIDGADMRDDDRPLSAQGRKQALEVGGALGKQKVRFARIVTSPLVRAVETAELVAVAVGFDGGLDVHDAMRPDGSWKHLLRDVLMQHDHTGGRSSSLALVGHEPTIGHYLSKLLHQKGLSMQKGAVVRLDWIDADSPAKLVWTVSPKRLDPSPTL